MKRSIIAAAVVFVIAGTTAVYAQHWPGRSHGFWRPSTEDLSALADARIAAVKTGLRLTAEQEKFWPPVESAARDLAKQRIDRIAERREARRSDRDQRTPDELFDRFKRRADDMTTSAAAMKKLAEAAEPLYRSLNDDQKRRLVMLARLGGHHHHGMMGQRSWRERTDFDGPQEPWRFREHQRGDWRNQPERL